MADRPENQIWAVQGFDGGLVTNYPAHVLDGGQSPDAENFDPSSQFRLKKRVGSSNFTGNHGSPTGTLVRGLGIAAFENGTNVLVAKEGSAVYNVNAGNWSTTITGHPALTDAANVRFEMFKNLLIMVSSTFITPQKWTGSGSFSNLSGTPPAGQFICHHKSRLWIAHTSADPSRVYFSALENAEDWTASDNAGNFFVAGGDGMVINGMASDGESLYISKVNANQSGGALYIVVGDTPAQFKWKRIAWFGAVNQQCLIPTSSFVVAATPEGIYGLSGTDLYLLSEAINSSWTRDLTVAQRAESALGRYKDQIWLSYPASGSTATKAYVLDIVHQRWSRYSAVPARLFVTHPDERLFGASSSSTINVVNFNNTAVATDLGSAIVMYWTTPQLDFGRWFQDKELKMGALHLLSNNVTWAVTRRIDYAAFGDSQNITTFGSNDLIKRVYFLGADTAGRLFQIKVQENDTVAAGELYGIELEAVPYARSVK